MSLDPNNPNIIQLMQQFNISSISDIDGSKRYPIKTRKIPRYRVQVSKSNEHLADQRISSEEIRAKNASAYMQRQLRLSQIENILTEADVKRIRLVDYVPGIYKKLSIEYRCKMSYIKNVYMGKLFIYLNTKYPPKRT